MKIYKHSAKPISFFDEKSVLPFFSHVTSAGDMYAYHKHDFYEIVCIQKGKITHIVNDESQELSYGNIVFLRPTDRHVYLRDNVECSHRDLVFESKFFEETCSFLYKDFLAFYFSHDLPIVLTASTQLLASIEDKINKINQYINDTSTQISLVKILLSELLFLFYEKAILSEKTSKYPSIVTQVINEISVNFDKHLYEIVSVFNYDNAYLSRLFKQSTGMTMLQYLTNVRLNFVTSQLKLTNKTILEISNDAGFSSVSHLNKIFKSTFGITPSQFKKTRN